MKNMKIPGRFVLDLLNFEDNVPDRANAGTIGRC